MIGLDSNVLIRYLTQDDVAQAARATRLMERELSERVPGFISLLVLVETCWVLKRIYSATPDEITSVVRNLLDTRQLVIERRASVGRALEKSGADNLADALIADAAIEAGCARIVTFDRKAARLGMTLLS